MSMEVQLINFGLNVERGESSDTKTLSYRDSLALPEGGASVVSEEIDADEYSINPSIEEEGKNRRISLRIGLLLTLLLAVVLAIVLTSDSRKQKKAVDSAVSGASEEVRVAPTAAPSIPAEPINPSEPSIPAEPSNSLEPSNPAEPSNPLELTPEFLILKPQVTDPSELLDPETPQGKAFQQILSEAIAEDTEFRITQRYAMMVIYHSMGGENWAWQSGWNDFSSEECDWHGVAICRSSEGRRIAAGLQIASNNAIGSVPEEICMLDYLESLQLENNYLVGELPACVTSLSNVFKFDVHNNQLSGRPPLGFMDMPQLETLDLSSNTFSGGLDFLAGSNDSFGSVESSKISILRLHNNRFVGDIPADLFDLGALAELSLQDTLLTGDVSAMCDKPTIIVLTTDCSKVLCNEQCCSCV